MSSVSEGEVVQVSVSGVSTKFFVNDRHDTIQRDHLAGRFYEMEELGLIAKRFPPGGVFLDIGANIGNHSLYACKFLDAALLIAVEPNPAALTILEKNFALNGIDEEMCVIHRVALSDEPGIVRVVPRYKHDLGATQVLPYDSHEVQTADELVNCTTGDDLLGEEPIDFIKIDVEGLALSVLNGLQHVIHLNRPAMFIELDDADYPRFETWLEKNRYVIDGRYVRYETRTNYLVMPVEQC